MGGSFTYLARQVGFDAQAIPGTGVSPKGSESVHAWTEITIDGTAYTFDPQIESVYKKRYNENYDLFMKKYGEAVWGYKKPEVTEPEQPETVKGTYLPEYEGELRAALDREESDRSGKNEQEGGRYILAVHQGDTVCTLFFKKITLECEGTAVITEVFEDEKKIWKKRRILERILKIGMRVEPDTHFFTEYEHYMELICSYTYEKLGAEGYGYRDLDRLAAEDREKGTDFYRSLKEYLLSGNHVNHAAKNLYIHRNTMVYRLAKIHEILGLDINQPDISRKLLLTMILREFQCGQKE